MLGFPTSPKQGPKCVASYGTMGHLDPKQPPVKRNPFAAVLNQRFVHQVQLILPKEIYEIVKTDLIKDEINPIYSRVILPLRSLVEGEIFNEYIKKRRRTDALRRTRILTLHLDKESYERAGIVGKPEGVKGGRGSKPRWVVEINLRLPSMLHGKKGFDRIVYAFKNVLTAPVTWFFCDLSTTAPVKDLLDQHFPTRITCQPIISQDIRTNMPTLAPPAELGPEHDGDFEEFSCEIYEWLSLVCLESPRIDPDDNIDSFLSRYVPPGSSNTSATLVKVTWQGFLTSSWAHKMFVQALLAIPRDAWFAYSVGSFSEEKSGNTKACTVLKLHTNSNEYVLWELSEG
ncbi:hypothetical protein B7463_g405, partial [Scytalidium lignicola]